MNRKQAFPRGKKSIAAFWAPNALGDSGKVWFRETKGLLLLRPTREALMEMGIADRNTLRLASSEVSLQYKYPESFRAESVLVVTWENVAPADLPGASEDVRPFSRFAGVIMATCVLEERNLFQISIILSSNGTFAHMVYSKLRWHDFAVVCLLPALFWEQEGEAMGGCAGGLQRGLGRELILTTRVGDAGRRPAREQVGHRHPRGVGLPHRHAPGPPLRPRIQGPGVHRP